MSAGQQKPGSVRQMSDFLQMLSELANHPESNPSRESATRRAFQASTILPSKAYIETKLSDSAHAVLGDVYQFYNHDHAEQQEILQEFKEQLGKFCQRQDYRDAQFEQALRLITDISRSIQSKDHKFSKQGSTLSSQDLSAVLADPRPEDSRPERTSEQALQLCESIARRRRFKPTSFVDPAVYGPQLNEWLGLTGSALLHLTTGPLTEDHATDIVVRLAAALKESGYPTVWFLPIPGEQVAIHTVLRSIILQLLQHHPDVAITTNSAFDPTMLEEHRSFDEWIKLFRAVLNSVPMCFMVLELPKQMELTDNLNTQYSRVIANLIEAVTELAGNHHVLKVLVVTHGIPPDDPQSADDKKNYMKCAITATPVNIARARRLATGPQTPLIPQLQAPVLSID